MEFDFTIQQEKLAQASALLKEHDLDVWITFVRETSMSPDPTLGLILGFDLTWQSALILTRTGEKIAIVGRYDADNVARVGGYSQIIAYDENIVPHLRNTIARLDPRLIAVNYSENDVAADGLSYGMWLLLNSALADTPYKHRLVTAEKIIGALRGRKTKTEIERVRAAVKTTEQIILAISTKLAPGQNALELYDFVNDEMEKRNVKPAWSPCPMVTPGPDAPIGHAAPDPKYVTQAGHLLHMDLGVEQDGYVSDIQRVWYLKKADEDGVPQPVLRGFNAVRGAILAAANILKPGVKGWEVDAAARDYLVKQGYPEFKHALGHHIGRSVHDGSTLLGPKWAKYGKMPDGVVEAGNIFTLELHVTIPEYGLMSLEEDVLVTDTGMEWLTIPQTEVMVVRR